tara:strand:- start:331 stop:834 length:504 start_codon:yes stop_codon:yes gene_type:complete
MSIVTPKIVVGLITTLLAFAAFLAPHRAQSEPSSAPPYSTIDVTPYLILPPTTTTSTIVYIDPFSDACTQLSGLAINEGWPVKQRATLQKIMKRESNCIPMAHNANDPGEGSFGLMQINSFWCSGQNSFLQQRGLLTDCQSLLDPNTNLQAALLIWQNSRWNPWGGK